MTFKYTRVFQGAIEKRLWHPRALKSGRLLLVPTSKETAHWKTLSPGPFVNAGVFVLTQRLESRGSRLVLHGHSPCVFGQNVNDRQKISLPFIPSF